MEYDSALKDAEKAIQLQPNWAKGYLRKGQAAGNIFKTRHRVKNSINTLND